MLFMISGQAPVAVRLATHFQNPVLRVCFLKPLLVPTVLGQILWDMDLEPTACVEYLIEE